MSINGTLDPEDVTKEWTSHKRKLKAVMDDGSTTIPPKLYNIIALASTKPSYLLGVGATNVRRENRVRLRNVLRTLVRQQNWTEASGVLSTLLKGTSNDNCSKDNRFKFWVSMNLLKHIHGDRDISTRIRHIYDIWMKRIDSVKDQSFEDRLVVHLEFIITFLTQGLDEEAYQAALGLKQQKEFGSHPMSYMFMGLTLYQLWYSGIPEEMQRKFSDQFCTSSQSESHKSGPKLYNDNGNSDVHDSVYSQEAYSRYQYDSIVSVKNDERVSMEADADAPREVSMEAYTDVPREVSMDVNANLHRESSPQCIQPESIYMNSDDSEASFDEDGGPIDYAIFSVLEGLDASLFPFRFLQSADNSEDLIHLHRGIVNDQYKDAIKYFRLALYSEPPVLMALIPLIQLLLVGGKVNEALSELEKFSSSSSTALPSRARILECFDPNNYAMLSTCFEDCLKKDPACCYSLAKLISMHQNGSYNTESLLEMIGLHLDATYAEYSTWREFALCFLKLSEYEEDRLSVFVNGHEDGKSQASSVHYNKTPKIFTEGKSGKGWRFRCKWWLRRHFNKNMFASESVAGDLQLVTYKAACASHMYGKDFEYVVKAYSCLQTENTRDLLTFLQMHMQNSIALVGGC
ncbi:hypothetical protein CFOL_v3_07552 [Cephalotus follicularis]|uniref:Uncharacterized protein n=1 Tax=Cephalotus follicularis TaxID=3775 RepID=A0A1Q3B858_CEPFO|nr:hypothetical protein CFOL_v3_07552 [Cephalotus follicularis]